MKTYLKKAGLLAIAMLIGASAYAKNVAVSQTLFGPNELPKHEGVDLFTLGKLSTFKDIAAIKAPAHDESTVQFSFITEDGLPVNFLIRRTHLTRKEFDQYKTSSQEAQAYLEKVQSKHGKSLHLGKAVLTGLYIQHPTRDKEYKQIGSFFDGPDEYRLAPTFDTRIYPNGLVVLDFNGRSANILEGTGDKSAQELLTANGSAIEIGGGKTATPAELLKLDIK